MTSSNFYFNNFKNSMEQDLIENLIIESIAIYGHGVFYCPRTLKNFDEIYGEDKVSQYNSAYDIDMYIRSFDSYEGDGTFLSKFNLEIRDQITFTVANRTFYNEVTAQEPIIRPQEGDLIYSNMMKRLFVIKFVNNKPIFYQMGALQMYDLVCEVFEYSSEEMNTGIAEIDALQKTYSTDMSNFGILTNTNKFINDNSGFDIVQGQYSLDTQSIDVYADNDEIQLEAEGLLDWSAIDPFSSGDV